MHKKTIRFTCSLILLFASGLPASAQQSRDSRVSLNYGFVSPNTREGLKLEDAISNLNSPEEEALIREARGLACVARAEIGTLKAVGSWSDGAEHSVLLRVNTDEQTVRYVVAVLGRKAEQKAVLYFKPRSDGTALIYTLRPQKRIGNLSNVARALDKAGIQFRTLVPLKRSALIYVVDLKRDLRAKVFAAARKLSARVGAQRGSAEFIGDDLSREKAKALFDQEIQTFEAKNPELLTRCQNQKKK